MSSNVRRVEPAPIVQLAERLDLQSCDLVLLLLSVTHRSWAFENDQATHNERLEFLGDSVLGLIVTDSLYRNYPDLPEGQLAKMRSAVVNSAALAEVARTLGLGDFLLLGKGEETTGGRNRTSILADAMEAVIGAVCLGCGLDVATDMVHRLFDPIIEESGRLGAGLDWKTSLQELASALSLGVPEYVINESGPDHAKSFIAVVRLADADYGLGEGTSKKRAEQQAAATAFEQVVAEFGDPRES